ncbi:MAG: ATP synthase F1 subunit gamma [Myxococcota bacterium]|nr:ATP synthase F1 subunit gamma [Myxococcota bacterium]
MASLSDIKRRIGSVKNTRKITRAMKMVATAKMRRATEAATAAQPYQETLKKALNRVVAAESSIEHPLLTVPENKTDVLLLVLTSDRGLCGGFNSQLIKFASNQAAELEKEGKKVRLLIYGRKGGAILKAPNFDVMRAAEGANPKNFDQISSALCDELIALLNNNAFEKVVLIFNRFVNRMTQSPIAQQLLPMKLEDSGGASGDYLYEPSGKEILSELLPMVLNAQLLQAFLDTEAGEQAARMQAMDNATRNAGEMIDKLTLQYNRARQAAITKELIEIISGAEAL